MSGRIVTLITDFGLEDPYAGMMQGVILSRAPGAVCVALTHAIPPQDVRQAAIFLRYSYPYFPAGTVHLAVVDPGVGTDRAILAAECCGQFFVAPDNGLLSPILRQGCEPCVVRVDRPDLYLENISSTFHGRDIMSPVAAALLRGVPVAELGRRSETWATIELPVAKVEKGGVTGELLYSDRFGNLVSSVRRSDLESAGIAAATCEIRIGGKFIAGVRSAYAEVGKGQACAIFNSAGQLEIAVHGGSAVEALGTHPGARVLVTRR